MLTRVVVLKRGERDSLETPPTLASQQQTKHSISFQSALAMSLSPRQRVARVHLSRYLLKTPDEWLNSVQGSKAKRKIEEALAARSDSSGELHAGEEEGGADAGLRAEGGRQSN